MTGRRRGLRSTFGVTMLALGLGIGITGQQIARHHGDASLQELLLRNAEVYASVIARQCNLAGSPGEIERLVYAVGSNREVHSLIVVGGARDVVLGATTRTLNGMPRRTVEEPLLAKHTNDVACRLEPATGTFAAVVPAHWSNLNLADLSDHTGAVFVRIDAKAAIAQTNENATLVLLALVATAALSLLSFLVLTRRHILRPLRILRETMAARRDGDETARAQPLPNADFQHIADSLHELFDSLARSEGMQRVIVASAADAIVTIDVGGIVRQWNPAAERLLGIPANDAIGTNVRRILPEPHASAHGSYLRRYLDTGVPHVLGTTHEVVAVAADGTRIPVGLSINEARIGSERLFVGILRDMTWEVTARDELRAAKNAADAAAAAKAVFLANMSHEIRTPLTAILGYSEELDREDATPADLREATEIIRKNGEHLLSLINDILDLSKIEAGKMAVEKIPTRVDAIAMDVVRLLKPRAQAKGLALDLCLLSAMPESVLTDPTRVRQVLLNLVGNAIKFTPSGSVVVTIEAMFAAERLQFSVVDTGIGIAPDQLAKLFGAFAQGDDSTTRKYGGTGLGLDISRRLATMLGGSLTAESLGDGGSRFQFSIATGPMKPATTGSRAAAVNVQPRRTAVPTLTGRVLLAEDGVDNQRLLRRILTAAGLEVVSANNGEEALQAVRTAAQPFDLVLMDMQMPVMDGLTATRQLRESGLSVPIVAITANVMAEDRARAAAAGCSHFACKPIDRRALYTTLQEALAPPRTP